MIIAKRLPLFFLSLLLAAGTLFAQQGTAPFWEEIQGFKKEDSLRTPAKNAILFVGSSSFRLWHHVQSDFPGHAIINRGFGGSSLPDVIRYAPQIILPYQPKQVVIYCGENDFAASDTVSAQTVYNRFTELFTLIRTHLPKAAVAFVSIKPSPSRAALMPKMVAANNMIARFLKGQKRTKYVDVYSAMLDKEGKPREELFVDDKLHMNRQGYAIWQKKIQPVLLK